VCVFFRSGAWFVVPIRMAVGMHQIKIHRKQQWIVVKAILICSPIDDSLARRGEASTTVSFAPSAIHISNHPYVQIYRPTTATTHSLQPPIIIYASVLAQIRQRQHYSTFTFRPCFYIYFFILRRHGLVAPLRRGPDLVHLSRIAPRRPLPQPRLARRH
jgi:hypothetical protein